MLQKLVYNVSETYTKIENWHSALPFSCTTWRCLDPVRHKIKWGIYVNLLKSNHDLALRYISLSGAWVPASTHAEPLYIYLNYYLDRSRM